MLHINDVLPVRLPLDCVGAMLTVVCMGQTVFWPPDSCLKVLWLLVKGQLGRTNEVVFRSGRAPKPTKKQ